MIQNFLHICVSSVLIMRQYLFFQPNQQSNELTNFVKCWQNLINHDSCQNSQIISKIGWVFRLIKKPVIFLPEANGWHKLGDASLWFSLISRARKTLIHFEWEHLPKWLVKQSYRSPEQKASMRNPDSSVAKHLTNCSHQNDHDQTLQVILRKPNKTL